MIHIRSEEPNDVAAIREVHRLAFGQATYVTLAALTIALGLVVHLGGEGIPPAPRDILGDALWATMLAWWVGALVPGWSIGSRAAVALAGSYVVEASQLLHTPWLDAVRRTRLGHLVLGSGFDPRDLLAYAGGVLMAVLLERAAEAMLGRNRRRQRPVRRCDVEPADEAARRSATAAPAPGSRRSSG